MPDIALPPDLPCPPMPVRERTQLEAFLVLRRNPLELWGGRAYHEPAIPGSFLGRRQLLLNAPEGIRHVLITNAENYGRNIGTRRVLRPIIGEGLFLAEGAAWKHQRRTIAPALAPRASTVLARHVAQATALRETLLDTQLHRPIELMPHLQLLALDIAGQSMFSLEVARHAPRLRALLTEYADKFARPGLLDLVLPSTLRSPLDRGRAQFRARWERFIDGLIAARLDAPDPAPAPRDLLDLLAAARDPQTNEGFTRAQLRDEVATMIVAGHETTAVALFWALYLLARFPRLQDQLAEQAAAVSLEADDAASAIALLPGIRAHVDETLRLYPPAFMIVREALAADRVEGHDITPGTVVVISPWVLHRHHAHWHDPARYDFARFAPGAAAPERFAYLPFGAGPRLCIGAQFALTEAVLVIARLLKRYRFAFAGAGTVLPRGLVTTQPDRPVLFTLTPR